jgi:hypothetical protein
MDNMSIANDLESIFTRRRGDGAYHYSTREARDALVSLILAGVLDIETLPRSLSALLDRFLTSLGVDEHADPSQLNAAVSRYFEANPLSLELQRELARFGRGVVLAGVGTDDQHTATATRLVGAAAQAKRAPRLEDQGRGAQMIRQLHRAPVKLR